MSAGIRLLILVFVGLSTMGTSCVRSVYSVKVIPLKKCPSDLSVIKEFNTNEWLVTEGKKKFDCGKLRPLVLRSKKKAIAEYLLEAHFVAGVIRTGSACEWRTVLEIFCGKRQSIEDCKKELPYLKEKMSLRQVSDELHAAILDTMGTNVPELKQSPAILAEPLVLENSEALSRYCH